MASICPENPTGRPKDTDTSSDASEEKFTSTAESESPSADVIDTARQAGVLDENKGGDIEWLNYLGPSGVPSNVRILETGEPRITETGEFRILE
jgi:hypothetical protein